MFIFNKNNLNKCHIDYLNLLQDILMVIYDLNHYHYHISNNYKLCYLLVNHNYLYILYENDLRDVMVIHNDVFDNLNNNRTINYII